MWWCLHELVKLKKRKRNIEGERHWHRASEQGKKYISLAQPWNCRPVWVVRTASNKSVFKRLSSKKHKQQHLLTSNANFPGSSPTSFKRIERKRSWCDMILVRTKDHYCNPQTRQNQGVLRHKKLFSCLSPNPSVQFSPTVRELQVSPACRAHHHDNLLDQTWRFPSVCKIYINCQHIWQNHLVRHEWNYNEKLW